MGAAGPVITRRLCAVPSVRRDRRDRAVRPECGHVPYRSHFCLGQMTRNSQEGWTILVVSDETARSVVKRLRKAGFVKSDSRGSHTKWRHPESGEYVVVATGHRMISAGVVRQVDNAIERSTKGS
jgi:predicted RNA binding protein YcfA (HicA-like mRNA interferase family)